MFPSALMIKHFSLKQHKDATRENGRYEERKKDSAREREREKERDEDKKIMSKMSKRWRIRGSFSRYTARAGPIVGPHNTVMI